MAEQEFKFKRLADVELVDEAPDTAHALAEVDGEIKRVAGGIGGGGAGGYLVDATGEGEFTLDSGTPSDIIVTVPVPGLLETVAKGGSVVIKTDATNIFGGSVKGYCAYLPCTFFVSYFDFAMGSQDELPELPNEGEAGYDEVLLTKSVIISAATVQDAVAQVIFTNGHSLEELSSTASLSTLSATPAALKLKGLKGGNAVAE